MRKGALIGLLLMWGLAGTGSSLLVWLWSAQALKLATKTFLQTESGRQLARPLFVVQERQSDLVWEETHEFWLDGELYDVIRSERIKGGTRYWVFADRTERDVKQQIARMWNEAHLPVCHNAPPRAPSTEYLPAYITWVNPYWCTLFGRPDDPLLQFKNFQKPLLPPPRLKIGAA